MQLHTAIQTVFSQLSATLGLLQHAHYNQPCHNLSHATIGQHTRHIIEMFQCLLIGYESGIVNYEKRLRNRQIEQDKQLAIDLIHEVNGQLDKANRPMILEATYRDDSNDILQVETNYYREIAYNLEHTIHHMALIRVGLREVSDLAVPDAFGVAPSTIKHRNECAQ
ncbi:hypothetical protein [Flavihumibacter petaseus]|uniref:DinB family protein n=1 Tax=Flavihumibacter petaseus NBRC 106054 TaxID=1220578 RepID=A0A0E9N3K6_9BACT|nr:hypothetical protein [Flavihumibacter petaseus]GAO44394.1 hypothetical protein FPE01S_03_04320 [Flavihumibacter petaseus NBRC 106054]